MNYGEIKVSDIKRLMLRTYRRFSNGEISESRAFRENVMLGNILKAFEAEEFEKRLEAIEQVMNTGGNQYEED